MVFVWLGKPIVREWIYCNIFGAIHLIKKIGPQIPAIVFDNIFIQMVNFSNNDRSCKDHNYLELIPKFVNYVTKGLIKLRGDKCWKDLTCMNYFYEVIKIRY